MATSSSDNEFFAWVKSFFLRHHTDHSQYEWSAKTPSINLTILKHGTIADDGRPRGFYFRPNGKNPDDARVNKILVQPNAAGIYSAEVSIHNSSAKKWLKKHSVFFPDTLTEETVLDAITRVFKTSQAKGKKKHWGGRSFLGFTIMGYSTENGRISTAFPVFPNAYTKADNALLPVPEFNEISSTHSPEKVEILKKFLISETQGHPTHTKYLADVCDPTKGERDTRYYDGNLYSLKVQNEICHVQNLYNREENMTADQELMHRIFIAFYNKLENTG